MIKDKWESYQVEGNRISVLKENLKLLKADLKEWNKSVFGCVESDKRRIEMEIEKLDEEDDIDALEDEGRLRRMDLLSQLGLVNRKLESIYRQKARVNWLKHGDFNSKLFHSTIRWRRLRNEVKGVEVNSQWYEEPKVVRREAKLFFEKRFMAT